MNRVQRYAITISVLLPLLFKCGHPRHLEVTMTKLAPGFFALVFLTAAYAYNAHAQAQTGAQIERPLFLEKNEASSG